MSTASNRARAMASILSVFAAYSDMILSFMVFASVTGIPAFSNASNDFIHMLPVDSQTARHLPYCPASRLASASACRMVLTYCESSKMLPLSSMTHT